ncbi:uncharacterized protein LOC141719916 [Apium graveolens]|uniref:uncharacterized protein LOC141719916 n=1 Tax=Apium graveolens TaxID=4045 RepID=UPI003D7B88A5
MIPEQQYRERNFRKYSELISLLLVAENNNELLLKNHQIYPTGSAQLPKYITRHSRRISVRNGIDKDEVTDETVGMETFERDGYNNSDHQKWQHGVLNKRKAPQEEDTKDICLRCGAHGHWRRTCRTPKHLVDLYEANEKK